MGYPLLMASLHQAFWPAAGPMTSLPRRDRKGCDYSAYVPDLLMNRDFLIGGPEAADLSDAEVAIASLDRTTDALIDTEALARLLLRAESISSSKIEGLEVGPHRLLRAAVAKEEGEDPNDITALEVLGNIDAMRRALQLITQGGAINIPMLRDIHRELLKPTPIAQYGGIIRTTQNWIGGSSYNPCSADFVPPPPEYVESLLQDLCDFCNDDNLPTVAQAAIAHAQFETIHPFADGNGRVGRTLIHLVFRRRGLTRVVTPPVSLVLATRGRDYVAGLQATRYVGLPDSVDARRGMNIWLGTFASACSRSVTDSEAFEAKIDELLEQWNARIGHLRTDSLVYQLIAKLPGSPVVTTSSVMRLLKCTRPTAVQAVSRLEAADILQSTKPGRLRSQIFEARELIELFVSLERQLASPSGDTYTDPPVRPVPARKQQRR